MGIIHSEDGLRFNHFIEYPEINIAENAMTFISGESGCGKSSYLKILNKTVLPSQGKIVYKDEDIEELPVLQYRKKVLLVPQEVFLLDDTIEENFRFYYDAREEKPLSSQKIEEFLRICCLDFSATDYCTILSGGERQRVFLSIFLSLASKVLLLDEPTAALDENTSITLLANIKEYCMLKGITIICVCHNDSLIEKFSDYIIKLGEKK
ncbi:MAG: ABC transporter ATP-binding protein [Lachnospiraceae bacterium]